jgi:hypothetical protein
MVLDGYQESPLAQMIIAFVIGIIFAFLSPSLVLILTFAIVMENFVFAYNYPRGNWSLMVRVSVVFSSLAGWILGRSFHRLRTYFVSKKYDKKHGLRCICRERTSLKGEKTTVKHA